MKGIAPALLSISTAFGVVHAEGEMTPDAFRDALISELQSREDGNLCLSRLENAGLKFGTSQDACDYHAYTEAAYVTYLSSPSQLETILDAEADRLVSIMEQGADDSDFASRLVVQLRPGEFVKSANKDEASPLATRKFAGDMHAVLMLDSPETLSVVYENTLERHGLTEEQAFSLAATNTRQRMGAVVSDDYGAVTRMYSENGLISGQVWLPETCREPAQNAVYFLYDYNGVLKVSEDNPMGISKLLGYARNMTGEGNSLSETVVSCSDGQWTQLWPATHASLDSPNAG